MRSIFFRKTRLGLPAARSVQESVRASHQAQFTALCRLVLAAAASLLLTLGALAQEGPAPLQPGDVIVTNFSGVIDTGGGSEQDPAAGLAVDTAGNSAVILRLTDAPVVRNNTIQAAIVRSYKQIKIGQVLPIARTPGTQPYIYFGATSQFGLQIVKPDPATGAFVRLKSGAPKAQWMEGQWGPGGGAGSIWQVKPDGGVRLFATVPGNSAAGIGKLNSLFNCRPPSRFGPQYRPDLQFRPDRCDRRHIRSRCGGTPSWRLGPDPGGPVSFGGYREPRFQYRGISRPGALLLSDARFGR